MRADMGKIITERERGGSSAKSLKTGVVVPWRGHEADYDDQPKRAKISARSQYGYNHKEFTDVLSPLMGFIRKQVGRPWNKVYSEMCKILDKGKVTHKHVLDHVFNWVGRTVIHCKDGIYREPDQVSGFFDDQGKWQITSRAPDFYVHPKTGILKRNKVETKAIRKARYAKPKKFDMIDFGNYEYRRIGAIWFRFEYLPCPDPGIRPLPSVYYTRNFKQFWKLDKKQLSKKELRTVKQILENN
jgi:hypothetical protein